MPLVLAGGGGDGGRAPVGMTGGYGGGAGADAGGAAGGVASVGGFTYTVVVRRPVQVQAGAVEFLTSPNSPPGLLVGVLVGAGVSMVTYWPSAYDS